MKLEDVYQKVLKEGYGGSMPGMAIEVYLRRHGDFQQEKKQIAKKIANAIKQQLEVNVRPFGDTLQNGSSVLELTASYSKDIANQESVPDTSGYKQILRELGLQHFSVYPT